MGCFLRLQTAISILGYVVDYHSKFIIYDFYKIQIIDYVS